MFNALAGMYMAAKVQLMQAKTNITKSSDKQISETVYKNKIDKLDEKEKFKRSKLPESGYMTLEEYEDKSRALTRKTITAEILDKPDLPKDKNYVYVPQHVLKLVKYNDPVGSPELTLPRRLMYNRQVNAQGIISSDFTMLVYPAVYYYAEADCVSSDLFLIKLDPKLSDMEKIQKANVLNKEQIPLLSTSKEIDRKFIFRTLTPIDFSTDNTKLIIKEKIGFRHDGIWKTDVWVYDFNKKEAKNLTSVREAVSYYWKNIENIDLDTVRWDIYPFGFDANNNDRVIVCAYAYTGDVPMFLGTWSIDVNNNAAKLESISGTGVPVSVVGYKMSEQHDVKPISELKNEEKLAKKEMKKTEKAIRVQKREITKRELLEYRRKIHQMDMDTLLKIREYKKQQKLNKHKNTDGVTDNLGIKEEQENEPEKSNEL